MARGASASILAALGLGLGSVLFGAGCGSTPPPAAQAATTGDADGDGILDGVDRCPDKKEDGLGSKPVDGCPND
jgi:hypothetical protein